MSKYSEMVTALAKPGQDIVDSVSPDQWVRLRRGIYSVLAAGEDLEALKKELIYQEEPAPRDGPLRAPGGMDAVRADMLHMAVGIAGEACELLELVFGYVYESEQLDRDAIVKELGDSEFYTERMRQILGVTREHVLKVNADKLSKRYTGGIYSNAGATTRLDTLTEMKSRGVSKVAMSRATLRAIRDMDHRIVDVDMARDTMIVLGMEVVVNDELALWNISAYRESTYTRLLRAISRLGI